jgi:hypothetical protein
LPRQHEIATRAVRREIARFLRLVFARHPKIGLVEIKWELWA